MTRLVPIGRLLFALALLGLGAEHFLFGEFVTGRPPAWPGSIAAGRVWAYVSGAVFVLSGAAIAIGFRPRAAAVTAGLLIFLWALLRNLPEAAVDTALAPSWTRAGKGLVLSGGAFAIAGTYPAIPIRRELLALGRACLTTFFFVTGIQHFIYTEFVASLIPAWFPGDAVFWTRFAGVALIAGGAGLLYPRTAPLAALLSGAMVFSWVWIVHLPRTFASVSDGIAIFEAVAVSGIALVLAGALRHAQANPKITGKRKATTAAHAART